MSLRVVVSVVVAGGLAAVAAGLSPLASGSPVVAATPVAAPVAKPVPAITGVVRAADTGRPLSQIWVGVGSTVDPRDWKHVLTDAEGRYRAPGLQAGGEYVVSFSPDPSSRYLSQYGSGATSFYRAHRYRAPAVVNASLVAGVPVSGRVTTSTGAASAHTSVVLMSLDDGDAGQAGTDHRGRWTATVRPGRYKVLSVRGDGTFAGHYPGGRSWTGAKVVAVGSRGRTGVDLRDPAPSRLEVTVTDAATRRPVDDVCVDQGYEFIQPPYGLEPGTTPGSFSFGLILHRVDACEGRGGRYTIGVDPGTALAEVTDDEERYAAVTTAPVRVGVGATAKVQVALARAGTVTGKVVDRITGRPLRACVRVVPVATPGYGEHDCARADGTWRVTGLAAGPVKVLIDGDETHVERYAPGSDTEAKAAVYQVRAGATTTVPTVRLERGGTISGRVLDARGRPLAGAGVQIAGKAWWDETHWTTTTDSAGRYRLTNVTAGPHKLKVTPPSYTGLGSIWIGGAGDARRARAVTVPYGKTVSLPDQRLKAGARLAVVLGAVDESVVVEALDPQGRIVGQAPVTLPIRPGRAGRTVTLTGLPATAVRVHAFSTRTDPDRESWLGGTRFATATPVVLTSGRTVTVSLRAPAQMAAVAAGDPGSLTALAAARRPECSAAGGGAAAGRTRGTAATVVPTPRTVFPDVLRHGLGGPGSAVCTAVRTPASGAVSAPAP